jgi:hypothetical protein
MPSTQVTTVTGSLSGSEAVPVTLTVLVGKLLLLVGLIRMMAGGRFERTVTVRLAQPDTPDSFVVEAFNVWVPGVGV